MKKLNRRQFMMGGAAITASGLFALTGCSPTGKAETSLSSTSETGTRCAIGSGLGKKGELSVRVVMEGSEIGQIDIVDSKETQGVGDAAMTQLGKLITDAQTLNVDTVSGATSTSMAYIAAVEEALEQLGENAREWKSRDAAVAEREVPIPSTADVVVVGSGGAGLSAALTAASRGKDVVLLEKQGIFGGSTALAGGETACPGNWLQAGEGLEDSADDLYEDMLASEDYMGDPDLGRFIADGAFDTIQWLTFEASAAWSPFLLALGGHSVKRCVVPKVHGGCEFTSKLIDRIQNYGGPGSIGLFNNAKVVSLETDQNGVTGITVEDLISGDTKRSHATP